MPLLYLERMNRLCLCFAFLVGTVFLSSSNAVDGPSNKQVLRRALEDVVVETPQKDDRIAIIGGGVHGILTARALKKEGYNNVVVFEKEGTLAKITESFEADGRFFDYSTKFIPADTTEGPGIPAEMKDLMDEYGLSLRPYTAAPKNYMPAAGALLPLPEILLPYLATPAGQQLLVSNLIHGFEFLKAVLAAGKTPEALINSGLVLQTETWAEFAERIQIPAFTDACAFYHDVFLGGPANDHPAATVLNVRAQFMPSYVKAFLLALGIGPDTTLPISDELRSVLSNPFPGTSFVVNEGYQKVFEAIVQQDNIEVCYGCGVTKIKKVNGVAGGQVEVYTGPNGKRSFDHVIISSRPYDTLDFLNAPSALGDLISEAADSQTVASFAFRAESTPLILTDSFVAIVFPASSTFPRDGTITGVAKDFPDSDVCVGIGYSNTDLGSDDEQGVAKAVSDLEEYGIPVSETLGYRTYRYPSVPRTDAVADNWFGRMTELQGVANIYVVGEALSGYGVPVALNFVTDFVATYFEQKIEI